jgi:hypothetical protein
MLDLEKCDGWDVSQFGFEKYPPFLISLLTEDGLTGCLVSNVKNWYLRTDFSHTYIPFAHVTLHCEISP